MRLIDGDYLYDELKSNGIENMYLGSEVLKMVKEEPKIEAIPKDQYENRLKADLKAILVELQTEIEELDSRAGYSGNGMPTFSTDYIRKKKVNEIIQQKINALKAESEDK